jgi:flagellar hook assembly protein FlgD
MIETGGIVQVRIFDVLGREVKTILDEFRNEGSHLAHWSGIDENRRTLSSGVYLCTLSLEGKLVGTTRLIILK